MTNWKTPTLFEHVAQTPSARLHKRILVVTESGNHTCKCDCCGRTTAADMMLDLRALPAGVRNKVGLDAGHEFACDGCTERWFREQRIPRGLFWQALGAPAATVARIREVARAKGENNADASA